MSVRRTLLIGGAVAGVIALSVTGGAVAGGMVGSDDIRVGAVKSRHIEDRTVHAPDISNGAVGSSKLRDGGVHPSDVDDKLLARIDAPGEDGAPGMSAYEHAVENGFDGTVEEWLASLVGEQGPQGEPGEPGADGADGADGEDGAPACPDGSELSSEPITIRTGAHGTAVMVDAYLCLPVAEEPAQ